MKRKLVVLGYEPRGAAELLLRRGVPRGVDVVYMGDPAGLPIDEESVKGPLELLESVAGHRVEVLVGAPLSVVEGLMALIVGHVYGALSIEGVELGGEGLGRGYYGALGPGLRRSEARVLAGMPARVRGLSSLSGRLGVPVSRLSVAFRRLEELGLVEAVSRRPMVVVRTRAGSVVAKAVELASKAWMMP